VPLFSISQDSKRTLELGISVKIMFFGKPVENVYSAFEKLLLLLE